RGAADARDRGAPAARRRGRRGTGLRWAGEPTDDRRREQLPGTGGHQNQDDHGRDLIPHRGLLGAEHRRAARRVRRAAFGRTRDLAFPEAERVAISRIEAVEPIDAHTVLIRWNGPFYLADALVHRSLVPLPAHILQAAYEAGDKQRFETLPYWTSEYVHAGAF